jgi:hypothetical protein
MGTAARANPCSVDGKPKSAVEFARLKTLTLRELVALWFRLMWRKVRRER